MRWMPSHSERKGSDLPPEVTPLDVKGNQLADNQAELAAEEHVINMNASSVVRNYSSLAQRIQKRNVCIMASLDARKESEVVKVDKILPKLPDPSVLFPFSSHLAFATESGFIKCARCNQSYHRKHGYVRKWLVTGPMLAQ